MLRTQGTLRTLRTEEGWIRLFQEKGALWIHDGNPQTLRAKQSSYDGNPKRPHALLTSGQHSNGFFNSKPIIGDERLLNEASSDLVNYLFIEREYFDIDIVDRVVGPATGATLLAKGIAQSISLRRERPCYWASPEKEGEGPDKRMIFRDTKVLPEERILLCEDVITTGESVALTAYAVAKAGGIVIPSYILILVNRSGRAEVGGRKIIALIHHPMPTWIPDECPLCKQGSEAIRPKGAEEWKRLNATY